MSGIVSFNRKILAGGSAALTLGVALLAACSDLPSGFSTPDASHSVGPQKGIFYGAARQIGDGRARTYLVMQDGKPVELGVALSEHALENLPQRGHGDGPHGNMVMLTLPMHPQNPTPFQFVEFNWNPNGHDPEQFYGAPHFDFHFYTISLAERNAIDPADPQWAHKARNFPSPEYVPPRYYAASMLVGADPAQTTVPRMGEHWVDILSPEYHGGAFTSVFWHGSWNGQFIFWEPMVTKALLESKPDFRAEFPVPQKYAKPGYYPSEYRVYWDADEKEYRVALSSLATRG